MRKLPLGNSGQAMTEYVVMVGALISVFMIFSVEPMPLFPMMLEQFQRYFDGLMIVVNLPIP